MGARGGEGALVSLVDAAEVRPDQVLELVLGPEAVGGVVGQQQRHASQAEDAVGDEH